MSVPAIRRRPELVIRVPLEGVSKIVLDAETHEDMDDHDRRRLGCVCQVRVPKAARVGQTLEQVVQSPRGLAWLLWAGRRPVGFWPDWFILALDEFLETHTAQAR